MNEEKTVNIIDSFIDILLVLDHKVDPIELRKRLLNYAKTFALNCLPELGEVTAECTKTKDCDCGEVLFINGRNAAIEEAKQNIDKMI